MKLRNAILSLSLSLECGPTVRSIKDVRCILDWFVNKFNWLPDGLGSGRTVQPSNRP